MRAAIPRHEQLARGYMVYVRLRRPSFPYLTAYPGIIVSQIQHWAPSRSEEGGWIVSINDCRYKRCAVAVEVLPGVWEPWAVLPQDVARPNSERLALAKWQTALQHGLPFIRAAIYCRDVPARDLFNRRAPTARPRATSRGPARLPFNRRAGRPDPTSTW